MKEMLLKEAAADADVGLSFHLSTIIELSSAGSGVSYLRSVLHPFGILLCFFLVKIHDADDSSSGRMYFSSTSFVRSSVTRENYSFFNFLPERNGYRWFGKLVQFCAEVHCVKRVFSLR